MFGVGLVFNYPNFIGMLVFLKLGEHMNTQFSIIVFFAINCLMLALIPVLSFIPFVSMDWRMQLALTLTGIFITGIATSVLTSKVFALTAVLPPEYTGAVMSGNGFSGIITTVIFFITYSAFDTTVLKQAQISAIIFFGIGGFVCILCIFGTILLNRLPFFQHYQSQGRDELTSILDEEDKESRSIWKIISIILPQAIFTLTTFTITLSLFPGVSSELPVQPNSWFSPELFPSITVAVFQVADVIGRTIPGMVFFSMQKTVGIPVYIRLIFVPIFLFLVKGTEVFTFAHIFQKDWITLTVMFVFAFTNGFLGTLTMMYGPSNKKLRNSEKAVAGATMGFFLQFGILLGQHIGILISYFLFDNLW